MKNFNKILYTCLFLFTVAYLSSCVNLDQKTTLKEDGSGSMKIRYWTKTSNVTGDELAGFGFTEEKARSNYSSSNTEIKDLKIEKNDQDSTTYVNLDLTFKDINKLPEAKGFSKVKPSWVKGDGGMDFKYTLLQDTANAKNFGMNEYKLIYEFDFPGEVTETNGTKDGTKVKWERTVADLKEDIDLTAKVKASGGCGLFGFELPIMVLVGMTALFGLNRKRKK